MQKELKERLQTGLIANGIVGGFACLMVLIITVFATSFYTENIPVYLVAGLSVWNHIQMMNAVLILKRENRFEAKQIKTVGILSSLIGVIIFLMSFMEMVDENYKDANQYIAFMGLAVLFFLIGWRPYIKVLNSPTNDEV